MTDQDVRHDREVEATIFGVLILGLLVLIVGVQLGIRRGRLLAEGPGVRDEGSVSEAQPRGSPAGPLSPAEIPSVTQQAVAPPDDSAWAWLKDEMASDCSPEAIAEMLTRARVYVETADGRTAAEAAAAEVDLCATARQAITDEVSLQAS